jgi:hypothetical protein
MRSGMASMLATYHSQGKRLRPAEAGSPGYRCRRKSGADEVPARTLFGELE